MPARLDSPTPGAAPADAFWRSLVAAASAAYPPDDGHARRFARAKLSGDRVFRHLLERGLVGPGALVLDLGCGQGLLASLLHAAVQCGDWPPGWAAAPLGAQCTGIDLRAQDIHRARAALGGAAHFVQGDMRQVVLPPCDVVACIDTLHYLAPAEQDALLARVRGALRPGGTLLLRVGDASATGRFRLGLWIDRLTMLLHGGGFGRLAGRPLAGWRTALERLGFGVEAWPMNGRPPFANLLIVARVPMQGGATFAQPCQPSSSSPAPCPSSATPRC